MNQREQLMNARNRPHVNELALSRRVLLARTGLLTAAGSLLAELITRHIDYFKTIGVVFFIYFFFSYILHSCILHKFYIFKLCMSITINIFI